MTTCFRRPHGSNTVSPHPVVPRRASLRPGHAHPPDGALRAHPAELRRASLRQNHVRRQQRDFLLTIPSNLGGPHCGGVPCRSSASGCAPHPVEPWRASLWRARSAGVHPAEYAHPVVLRRASLRSRRAGITGSHGSGSQRIMAGLIAVRTRLALLTGRVWRWGPAHLRSCGRRW
jgi:hypothetical protein